MPPVGARDAVVSVEPGSATLAVRVTPNASKSAIGPAVTLADGRAALGVRIAAPPVEGAANEALVALLAKSLGVRRSCITIVTGEASRLKRVRVAGDGPLIAERVRMMLDRS